MLQENAASLLKFIFVKASFIVCDRSFKYLVCVRKLVEIGTLLELLFEGTNCSTIFKCHMLDVAFITDDTYLRDIGRTGMCLVLLLL